MNFFKRFKMRCALTRASIINLLMPLCAGHGAFPRSVSLLQAVMTGTVRLGKGVHREVKSEGS